MDSLRRTSLLYRGFQTRRALELARCADLEIGDTAGLETCATLKTKQPPRGFARRLPLELYPGDVDFSTTLPVTVLSILYHPGRRLHHFNLCAHLVDLGGLLFELGCESHYLFLLHLDHYLQLLNFVIEHGFLVGVVGGTRGRAGRATSRRCATSRYARCPLARANIPAKVVVRKVKSNFNNAAANRLEVIEDTTDEALLGIAPREVVDADRTAFVADAGTNEVAEVSVIEAIDDVIS
jgi:hypothetical protein